MPALYPHHPVTVAAVADSLARITCVSLLACCVSLSACSSSGDDDDTTSPSTTPTQEPTPEPTPTSTPAAPTPSAPQPLTLEGVMPLIPPNDTPKREPSSAPRTVDLELTRLVLPLPDLQLRMVDDTTLSAYTDMTRTSTSQTHPAGTPSGLAWLETEQALVLAGSKGIFTVTEDGIQTSPLSDKLAQEGPARLAVGAQEKFTDLWLATSKGLHLHRNGVLYAMTPEGLPTANALIAWGSVLEGGEGLWVASGKTLYALLPDGDGYLASPLEEGPETITALSVDVTGTPWMATSSGALYHVSPTGTWSIVLDVQSISEGSLSFRGTQADEPVAVVQQIAAHPLAPGVWVKTDYDLWWVEPQRQIPVYHPPSGKLLGADSVGRALLEADAQLARGVFGRPTYVVGAPDDAIPTDQPTTLYFFPTLPEDVSSLSVSLGDIPLSLERDPWRTTLDPKTLTAGLYDLSMRAQYTDITEPVETKRTMTVGAYVPPGWEQDIKPIYKKYCSKCHSAQGGALNLDSAAAWETNILSILDYVEGGVMPPTGDPVTEEEIYTIRAWQAGGYLE